MERCWWALALCALMVCCALYGVLRVNVRAVPARRRTQQDRAPLVGQTAVVKQAMAPGCRGQVLFRGTVYLARNIGAQPMPVGLTCRVTAMDRLTLWVSDSAAPQ